METMSVFWLRAAVALYSIGLLHAICTVLERRSRFFRAALASFAVGALLHMVALAELWVATGRPPAENFFESVSLGGFLIAVLFLFVHWRYQFASLSVFLFPLVFLMALAGSMESPVPSWTNPRVRDAWLLGHVVLVLLGYAALALTSVASVFYLIQERQLKARRPAGFFERLPPLGTLDRLITRAMGIGFVLITLAVIAGMTWAFIESGTRWIGEAKVALSLVTWAFYLVMIFLRTSAGWRGRRAAILAITLLGCFVLTWAAHVGLRPVLLR